MLRFVIREQYVWRSASRASQRPDHVIDAAMAAARSGFTKYGPNGGLASLRELLAAKIAKVDGFEVDPDQVVVTPGGMSALSSTYLALVDPGDEVLLPTPGFPNMDQMVMLFGGVPVFYPLSAANGFLPDLALLEKAVTPRTKVLFINTPSNPTGAVFPPALVEGLVDLCRRHDLWLLSDEVYDELILEEGISHTAAGRFDTDGRVVTVYSFSKVYAMTGWRVGYATAPPALAATLRKLQEPLVSCPSTVSQKAAEAALTGPRRPFDEMLEAYRQRRLAAVAASRGSGHHRHPAAGNPLHARRRIELGSSELGLCPVASRAPRCQRGARVGVRSGR